MMLQNYLYLKDTLRYIYITQIDFLCLSCDLCARAVMYVIVWFLGTWCFEYLRLRFNLYHFVSLYMLSS